MATNDHPFTLEDLQRITTYQGGVMQATAHRAMQKLADELLKPYGITKMQWLIIGTVYDAGQKGMRTTDIANKLDTTLPYLTNTLNILEAKGIVERSSHGGDSRSKIIRITKDFGPRVQDIEHMLHDKLRVAIFAHVDPQVFCNYMQVLDRLAKLDVSS